MDTINGVDITKVSLENAISFCYDSRDEYIKCFDSVDEGIRSFDCLISILDGKTISVIDLPDYGMSDQEL